MFLNLTRLLSSDRLPSALLPSIAALLAAVTGMAPVQARETTLYSFQGGTTDGANPRTGLIADQQGNLYGTTSGGGSNGQGTVFKLTRPSGGETQWTETVLYSFCSQANCSDGGQPLAGVIFDQQGNLYGTTEIGGASANCQGSCGTVFKLTPPSGGATQWTETVLHAFQGGSTDGGNPVAGLIFDPQGNLYGTTSAWGWGERTPNCPTGCGIVFRLTPRAGGETPWTETVLYRFQLGSGSNPSGGLILDQDGALYGTTKGGGERFGHWYGVQAHAAGRPSAMDREHTVHVLPAEQ